MDPLYTEEAMVEGLVNFFAQQFVPADAFGAAEPARWASL
jgi:hypothetical protein